MRIRRIALAFVAVVLLVGCSARPCVRDAALEKGFADVKAKHVRNYSIDTSRPLPSRVLAAPDFVISYLKEMDSTDAYAPYMPTEAEMSQIAKYLELLPPGLRASLERRVIGIYFVENFIGSGLTDFVLAPDGGWYVFLVFNPDVLSNDCSSWVTAKVATSFIGGSGQYTLDIEAGRRYTGFMYILLHEGAHVADMDLGVTPYAEPDLEGLCISSGKETPFVRGVWSQYRKPVQRYASPLFSKVDFYGLGGGPNLALKDSPAIYASLMKTPFVSLYSTMSWAEDLADYFTFYYLTNTLGEPYEIRLVVDGKVSERYRPMENPLVLERAGSIAKLLK